MLCVTIASAATRAPLEATKARSVASASNGASTRNPALWDHNRVFGLNIFLLSYIILNLIIFVSQRAGYPCYAKQMQNSYFRKTNYTYYLSEATDSSTIACS